MTAGGKIGEASLVSWFRMQGKEDYSKLPLVKRLTCDDAFGDRVLNNAHCAIGSKASCEHERD
jgi:hypothetical protein